MELFSISWWGYIVAGLGIFLFGIFELGKGLRKVAGDKIKQGLDKFASNPIKAAAIGAFVTIFLHSAGTTTLTIGLIQAGLMNLTQASGIIMGANIGTTITSLIIGLNVSVIGPFILVVGAFFKLFGKKEKIIYIGDILFGLGSIFFGMTLMESALTPLGQLPEFIEIVSSFGKTPLLGLLVGAVGTVAINSSAAFIGIVQSLYAAADEFTLKIAIPLLLGSNIGTTFTSVIASMSGGKEAKKAALIHVLFNVIGTIIFMILLNPFVILINWLGVSLAINPKLQVALAHIIFNIVTTAILLPCTSLLVKLVNLILPEKEEENKAIVKVDTGLPDKNIVQQSPTLALMITKDKVIEMGELALSQIDGIQKYLNEKDELARASVLDAEKQLDAFDKILLDFLNQMERSSLSQSNMHSYSMILKNYKDIERIGDHCENLIEYFDQWYESKEVMVDAAKKDLNSMLTLVHNMLSCAIVAYKNNDKSYSNQVFALEKELDELNRKTRERQVNRFLTSFETGSKVLSSYFVDIAGNIERMGDHCQNIAETSVNLFRY